MIHAYAVFQFDGMAYRCLTFQPMEVMQVKHPVIQAFGRDRALMIQGDFKEPLRAGRYVSRPHQYMQYPERKAA